MIIGATPTPEQIIEVGIDLMVQCISFNVEPGEIETKLSLNIMGIIYSVTVPTHELSDPKNIKDSWSQLINDFSVFHLLGQTKRIQDGNRELEDDELAILESKSSP